MNPHFHTDFSISDSLIFVRKSVLIYETIIESCQKYCPVSEECMATDENVRCTECEYLCETCGICELKE